LRGGGNGQIVLNLFNQADPLKHRKERRPLSKPYSSAGITTLEPHMDKVINQLRGELQKRYVYGDNAEKVCNIGQWILSCKSHFTLS
jgi:hypothetical protein